MYKKVYIQPLFVHENKLKPIYFSLRTRMEGIYSFGPWVNTQAVLPHKIAVNEHFNIYPIVFAINNNTWLKYLLQALNCSYIKVLGL